METQELRDRIKVLTVPKSVLSQSEVDECYRLCEVVQRKCRQKADKMVQDSPSSPAAFVYMCDGWSASVSSSHTKVVSDEHVVLRRGKYKHEFLLERGLLKKKSRDMQNDMAVLFGYPRGLCKGRSAWNCFTAALEFRCSLREMGAKGIALEVMLVDGQLFSALGRHLDGARELFYDEDLGVDLGADREALRNSEWPLKIKCKAHGCSNGVVWALKPVSTKQRQLMAHNAIRSLKGSSEGFFGDIDLFLIAHVVFRDSDSGEKPEDVRAYWNCLRVEEKWLDLFVETNIMFDGTNVVVDPRMRVDPEAMQKLSGCVQYCLRSADWSETRWCKVRKSSTLHLQNETVGVRALVRRMLRNPDLLNSYLGGYETNLTHDVRLYLATAAFAATPPEAVLLSLLKDNRLLKKVKETKWLLEFQAQYIWDLPDLVFARRSGFGYGNASHSHIWPMRACTAIAFS